MPLFLQSPTGFLPAAARPTQSCDHPPCTPHPGRRAPMPEHPSTPLVPIPDDDRGLLAECRIDTFRSGGKGGQHQNVTESGVRLTHRPTGIVVTSRQDRSQHRNRQIALDRLRHRLEQKNTRKRRRIKTRIPARDRRRRLEDKRRRSQTKRARRKPRLDGSE